MQNRQLQLGRSLAVIGFSFRREKETEEEEKEEKEEEEEGEEEGVVLSKPAQLSPNARAPMRGEDDLEFVQLGQNCNM